MADGIRAVVVGLRNRMFAVMRHDGSGELVDVWPRNSIASYWRLKPPS